MNTVTKKEFNYAKICIREVIKDCKYNPSFLDTYHFEYDKNDIETVFKSKNIQIDFCRRDHYFTVITDQLTFTLLKNEYGVLLEKELIRREKRRNSLLINKNSVTDKEYNNTLDCISKLVRDFASIPVASVIKYGFEGVDSLKADGEFMGLVTEFQSGNIEICADYYNQHIHVFTDPETFSRLKDYHDEYVENIIPTKVEPKPVESESKPESASNGLESLNTEASAIVKAYNTVNEVLDMLKVGSSDYRSDYSDRSNRYVSRAELMGIGLSALLTPDGDYSKTNMLKHAEHAATRYSRARGIFPGDAARDVNEHKREYYAAELRYLFVCILQDGLDAESDQVAEFYRIRRSI